MQRKASKLVFLSAGAALAWFLDPVSGAERRRQLTEQLNGLSGKLGPPSDPTGGAVPSTTAATPPPPYGTDADVLRVPDASGDGDDRADLRTSW